MTPHEVRCPTCDKRLELVPLESASVRCPNCHDRAELRCLDCGGALEVVEQARAWCLGCGRSHEVIDGALALGEGRRPVRPDAGTGFDHDGEVGDPSGSGPADALIEESNEPPFEPLTTQLSQRRRRRRADARAAFRDNARADGWDLERAPRSVPAPPSLLGPNPRMVAGSLLVVFALCFAFPIWFAPTWGALWLIAGPAHLAMLYGAFLIARERLAHRREVRAWRARELDRAQRVRLDERGIEAGGERIERGRIRAVVTDADALAYTVRVRLDDGEEVVLLDGLSEEEAELVEARVAGELDVERAR